MLFTDWTTIRNTAAVGLVTYIVFIVVVRLSGKRSLSQMNAYDFSVTVALGSIIATTLTNPTLSAVTGIFAFSLLLLFQFIVAKLAVLIHPFNKLIKSKPSLLFYKGKYDRKQMKKQRVTQDDILQFVREQQHASMDEILAVVLESNGKLSCIKPSENYQTNSTLQNIDHPFLEEDFPKETGKPS